MPVRPDGLDLGTAWLQEAQLQATQKDLISKNSVTELVMTRFQSLKAADRTTACVPSRFELRVVRILLSNLDPATRVPGLDYPS